MKRYAVSPVDTISGIVKGERYLISSWAEVSNEHPFGCFHITVDHHDCYCLASNGCAFIDGETWTIIEEEEPSE